jgi:hypothetical protein
MSGRELETHGLGDTTVTTTQQRAAAVHIADRIAADHPNLTAAEIAATPALAAGLLELLDQLGLRALFQRRSA